MIIPGQTQRFRDGVKILSLLRDIILVAYHQGFDLAFGKEIKPLLVLIQDLGVATKEVAGVAKFDSRNGWGSGDGQEVPNAGRSRKVQRNGLSQGITSVQVDVKVDLM